MSKRDELAGYHHTISEQLNARLAESPRFFWALVVVSTGYGYVLWGLQSITDKHEAAFLFAITSALAYFAVLWASWYLAALGYAFRFLQNAQHCMEHALRWDGYGPKGPSGDPPAVIKGFGGLFSLLPGIYHAHAFGLIGLLAIVVYGIYWHCQKWLGSCWAILVGLLLLGFGFGFIACVNVHYVRRYRGKWRNPSLEVDVLLL